MLVSGDKGIRENLMVGSGRRYRLSNQERCDEAAVHDLIGAIYNAALEPERWSDAIGLDLSIRGHGASLAKLGSF